MIVTFVRTGCNLPSGTGDPVDRYMQYGRVFNIFACQRSKNCDRYSHARITAETKYISDSEIIYVYCLQYCNFHICNNNI